MSHHGVPWGHPRVAEEARPVEVSATGWIAAKRMNSQVEVLGFVFPPEPAMKIFERGTWQGETGSCTKNEDGTTWYNRQSSGAGATRVLKYEVINWDTYDQLGYDIMIPFVEMENETKQITSKEAGSKLQSVRDWLSTGPKPKGE